MLLLYINFCSSPISFCIVRVLYMEVLLSSSMAILNKNKFLFDFYLVCINYLAESLSKTTL